MQIESLRGVVADTVCVVKSKVINKAIQDIGMGRYNWELFVLCGFGWFADKCVPHVLQTSVTNFTNCE